MSRISCFSDSLLRRAVEDNDIAQLKFVLRFEKEKVNEQDENQMTALHWSCLYGRHEMVALLLDNGADIEMRDSKGWTALHFAANGGFVEVVEMLLASCANISATSHDGKIAIDVAQGEGMVFLLAIGFIQAGKQDLLLKYFDSTTSLFPLNEEQKENNLYTSQQNLLAVEIWRASQQLLKQDFSNDFCSKAALKMSLSENGISKCGGHKENELSCDVNQRKRSVPMMPSQDVNGSQQTAASPTRRYKLNNFDSAFSPDVLRRFAVSESNLNMPHSLDSNNNNIESANKQGSNQFTAVAQTYNYFVDCERFSAAEESMI